MSLATAATGGVTAAVAEHRDPVLGVVLPAGFCRDLRDFLHRHRAAFVVHALEVAAQLLARERDESLALAAVRAPASAMATRSRSASTAPMSLTPSAYRSRAIASPARPSRSSASPQPSPISRCDAQPIAQPGIRLVVLAELAEHLAEHRARVRERRAVADLPAEADAVLEHLARELQLAADDAPPIRARSE